MASKMEEIIRTLDELFRIFNFLFFDGTLIEPVLAVQTNSRYNGAVMGWCTTKKVWQETSTQKDFYEITMCPEFFDLGAEDVSDTLLHELVHLHHLQVGIQDVSRGGYYHNQNFKKKAEECGMIVEKSQKNGWNITKLKPEMREYIGKLDINRDAFTLSRKRLLQLLPSPDGLSPEGQSGGSMVSGIRRQSYRKYVCPSCKMAVRATKDVNVKCADCDLLMEKEEKDLLRQPISAAKNY